MLQKGKVDKPGLADQAILRMQQGRYADAVEILVEVVQTHPDDWANWYHLGLSLANLNQTEAAVAAFANSTTLFPANPPAWNNLGMMLGKLGRWVEAAAAFDSGIVADPNYAKCYYGRANVYLMAGDTAKARKFYTLAVRKDPGYQLAKDALLRLDE